MPSLKASPLGLERLKHARKSKGWAIEAPQWLLMASQILDRQTDWAAETYVNQQIFAPGISLSTWRRFLRGEAINARVFQAFCQTLALDWEAIVATAAPAHPDSPSGQQDWGAAPDVPVFFGREPELAMLQQWLLDDRCRLVAILGLGGAGKTQLSVKLGTGGMGKTNLSVKLAQGIQTEFEAVIWRSLLNAPPLPEILSDWLAFLSNQQETQLPETIASGIARLLHYLQTQRCLLILDNVETILQGGDRPGQYREGYAGYGQLLKQIGEVAHQSCLLLTSREKPPEIARLEGKNRPVRSLALRGLEPAQGQCIFAEIGDFAGTESEWQVLIDRYSGNPLALELTAKHIAEVFGGNISTFLASGNSLFHDLRELLDWHFTRLSAAEQEIVYWLAINREPMSAIDLKADVLALSDQEQVPATLQTLQRRLPLERVCDRFSLQPVLIEAVTDRLMQQLAQEIQSGQLQLCKRYALLKATAKNYLREAQQQLLVRPLLARLHQALGAALERHLSDLIAQLQGCSLAETGYAGGNLLNLLVALNPDFSDRDFSHLAIMQAYLVGVTLHRTNWTNATLERCAFTEAISSIVAIAFSPDGQRLATGEPNGDLRLWNLATDQQMAAWKGHANWVGCVAFSPDGNYFASSSFDQTLYLWEVRSQARIQTFVGHQNWVRKMVFAADGRTLISSSDDQTIRVWDIATATCLQVLTGHSALIWSIALSPDGTQLASSSFDHTIRLWNLQTGACLRVLTGHTQVVAAVAFSPDGQTLFSGSRDQTLKLWQVATGTCWRTIPAGFGNIQALAFNPQRTIAATGGLDRSLKFWDVQTGTCLKTALGHTGEIWSIAFDATGSICASGGDDQAIRLWDVSSGRNFRTLQGFKDGVHTLASIPDRAQVISGHYDWQVRLWDLTTGACRQTFRGHTGRIWSVAYRPQGQRLASASSDQTVRLWDLQTGACLHVLHGHTNWVWSVALSPDGTLLASGDEDHWIKLWRVTTGELLATIGGQRGRVWSLDFSPDGSLLAAGSQDQTVQLWEVAQRKCIATLPNTAETKVWAARFSPDGQTIACSSSDHTLSLWSLQTQQCLKVLTGHRGQVWHLNFSPDGNLLASGSDDRTVKIWQVQTGECLKTLVGHTNSVVGAVFAADQATLCSGSLDGTIRFWNLDIGACLNTLSAPRPYDGMNITGIQGLTAAEQAALKALGAIAGHS